MIATNPYTELVLDALREARHARASDIHFQPEDGHVDIRFRIHGTLVCWKRVSATHKVSLLQEVKRLCNLKLSVSLRPQDARQSFTDLGVDLRANAIPSLHGEKVVLRVLERDRKFSLNESGLAEGALAALRVSLGCSSGVCLISGPTGSGKTTTLYSALRELDCGKLNIVTIEDPIEYTFGGITQTQISERMGFAEALKAMLRQDPDVILFGEIRDPESADLCFQAAATGHLVLSTLHSNSARDALGRLRNLGIADDRLQSNLRFSSAQRLLSRLCPECSSTDESGFRYRKSEGCASCQFGAVGRIPILETLQIESRSQREPVESEPLASLARELAVKGLVDAHEAREVA